MLVAVEDTQSFTRRSLLAAAVQAGIIALVPGTAASQATENQFLTDAQLQQLAAIGERIIPGSAAAKCADVIDRVMVIAPETTRAQLTKAISAFDTSAKQEYGKAFSALSPAQQDAMLTEAAQEPGQDSAFAVLKEWFSDAYWTSQAGLRELGWNGQVAWPAAQVCDEHHS